MTKQQYKNQHYHKHKRKYNIARWKRRTQTNMSFTLADFEKMALEQDNKCKICNKVESLDRSLSIDHCHITGKIRGLLCSNCNRAIGLMKDNVQVIAKALKYLMDSEGHGRPEPAILIASGPSLVTNV